MPPKCEFAELFAGCKLTLGTEFSTANVAARHYLRHLIDCPFSAAATTARNFKVCGGGVLFALNCLP